MKKIIIAMVALFFISSSNLEADRIRIVKLVGDEVGISKLFWENPKEFLLTQEFKKRHKQRPCFILAAIESNIGKEATFCDNWKPTNVRVFFLGEMMSQDEKNKWNNLKSSSASKFFFSENELEITAVGRAFSVGLNGSIYKHEKDNSCYETKKVNENSFETFQLDDFGYCAPPIALFDWINEIEAIMKPHDFVYNSDKRIWPHKDFKDFIRKFEVIPEVPRPESSEPKPNGTLRKKDPRLDIKRHNLTKQKIKK